jgi:predicted glycosyltransferase
MYFFAGQDEALEKAIEILKNPRAKEEWQEKRQHLFSEVIDVTSWLTEFVENYPTSFERYQHASGKP